MNENIKKLVRFAKTNFVTDDVLVYIDITDGTKTIISQKNIEDNEYLIITTEDSSNMLIRNMAFKWNNNTCKWIGNLQ